MNKKKLTLVIVLGIIAFILIAFPAKVMLEKMKIKNSFNEYVTTTKDTNLLNNNKEVVGTIENETYLELEKTNNEYFKIKDTDYYIYYKDVKKTEKKENNNKDYYVELGKTIKTNETTNLYQDEKLITLNTGLEFDAIKQDDAYYYINYMSQELKIKKDEIAEETEKSLESIASYISVINYNSVKDECDIEECITTSEFKEELNYLKENNYYSITTEDYKLWLNDNINLKDKAILLLSNEDLNNISNEYNLKINTNTLDITFNNNNTKSTKGNPNEYSIINKTTLDTFKKIVDGNTISYVVLPIYQQHNLPDENANATEIAVLNYHFFFDSAIGEECTDGNCMDIQNFEKELIFLQQNNYKTLTMDEFTKWMYGEIELPARSVLITIDDGALGTGTHNGNKLIPTLEKYQAHATLFLITGWWPIENYRSPYLDIESHTFDMHEGGFCEGEARGSKLLCSSKEAIIEDLTKSTEITGSKNAFCFPMYVSNSKTLEAIEEVGFKLAFVGGDYKASRNNGKYQVPRYHVYLHTTLDQFIDMIS